MKTKRRIISVILVVVMLLAFSGNAYAYDQAVRGKNVYGGPANVFLSNVSRQSAQMKITIYGDTQFNSEANITFRAYSVGGSGTADRRSDPIVFQLSTWYSGQYFYALYINGGGSATSLDLRASIPNSNPGAYATFYGYIII